MEPRQPQAGPRQVGPRRRARVAWIVMLGLVALGGVAIGAFLPGPQRPGEESAIGSSAAATSQFPTASDPVGQASPGTADAMVIEHSFPLSSFDIRDQIGSPQLATDGAGRVWLAWASRTGSDEQTLYLTRSTDGGQSFNPPRAWRTIPIHRWDVVIRGKPAKRESRLWPRLAYRGGTLYLSWVEPRVEDLASLTLYFARSSDGGETFSEPLAMSTSDAVRPTFAAFAVDASGRAAATWLDHRNGVQQPFAAIVTEGQHHEHLVFAGPDGQGICPCCNTAVTLLKDGTAVVAYRNNVEGFRDMWLSVLKPGDREFGVPRPVVESRWEFDGCPHDGPALCANDGWLHVAWMDAHAGTPRVYQARSRLDEWDFEAVPISPNTPGSQGHPALVAAAGMLHIAWDESDDAGTSDEVVRGRETRAQPVGGQETRAQPGAQSENRAQTGHAHHGSPSGSGRAIHHAVSTDGGRSFSPPRKLLPKPGAFQTRPAIAVSQDGSLHAAWCELSEQGKRIVVVRYPNP